MRVYFDSYSKWNGMKVAINSLADLSFLDRVVQDHNTGKIASWNPRMRLSYGYDTQFRQAYFEIACPPNLTDEFSQSTVGVYERFGAETRLFRRISEDRFGRFPYHTNTTKTASQIIATVEYTQPFVTYTLYMGKQLPAKSYRKRRFVTSLDSCYIGLLSHCCYLLRGRFERLCRIGRHPLQLRYALAQ